MRCTQNRGLTPKALEILESHRKIIYTVVEETREYPNGKRNTVCLANKRVHKELETVKEYGDYGMFSECSLRQYTFSDKTVIEEYVQAEPWSSGPVVFLALRDGVTKKPIPESLWTEEEIDECLR